MKAHLLLSAQLYVEFLIKRLARMTRTFLDDDDLLEEADHH